MGLLQDPIKALDQIEWFINNRQHERFPGAFLLAAGNLCRQTLEQILFILCFYSSMPRNRYLKQNLQLHTAAQMLEALEKIHVGSSTYWELARRRGPRIRKFARYPRTLKRWRREFNEPSHFSTGYRSIAFDEIHDFVSRARDLFDDLDKYLLLAAFNDLYSGGRYHAYLANDNENTPGVSQRVEITPHNLELIGENQIQIRPPSTEFYVISDTEAPRGPWPHMLVLLPGTMDMKIRFQFFTKHGDPVDMTSPSSMLSSFARTKGQRSYLVRRLRELGCQVSKITMQ